MTSPLQQLYLTFAHPVAGTEAAAFLARTTGLDTQHSDAYTGLINGLVADGIWSKLDLLYIYATQDTATAQLNLISSSYPATLNGSPTFTADRGYLGVDASSTVYINTGFNPTTASSPKYTRNSAHLSVWNLTNVGSGGPSIGYSGGTNISNLYAQYSGDGRAYFRVNTTTLSQFYNNSDARGFYIGSRTSSVDLNGFKDGASVYSNGGDASTALVNLNLYSLGINNNGPAYGVPQQHAMISIGSGLTSTDSTNYYNRLRTYMTAIGVP